MTINEKKTYLKQYRAIINGIKSLELQIKEIEDLRQSLSSIDYSKDRVQTSFKDSMLESIIRQEELETKLFQKHKEQTARLEDIINCINLMDNTEEQAVLTYRYINGLNWDDIAAYMYRSRRSVISLHGDALKNFAIEKK